MKGVSREVFWLAAANDWTLIATPYVLEEANLNLPHLSAEANSAWTSLRQELVLRDDVVSLHQLVVFPVTKDRPVLFSALAWADVLLTLDRNDFATLLGDEFYGLPVIKPGTFLERERIAGRLRVAVERS